MSVDKYNQLNAAVRTEAVADALTETPQANLSAVKAAGAVSGDFAAASVTVNPNTAVHDGARIKLEVTQDPAERARAEAALVAGNRQAAATAPAPVSAGGKGIAAGAAGTTASVSGPAPATPPTSFFKTMAGGGRPITLGRSSARARLASSRPARPGPNAYALLKKGREAPVQANHATVNSAGALTAHQKAVLDRQFKPSAPGSVTIGR